MFKYSWSVFSKKDTSFLSLKSTKIYSSNSSCVCFNWIKHLTALFPFIIEIDILLVFYSWTSCHSFISGHVTQCIQILAICYWISSIKSKLLNGSNVKTKTNSNFAVKVTERSNHSILLPIWWITFFRHLYDNGIRIT